MVQFGEKAVKASEVTQKQHFFRKIINVIRIYFYYAIETSFAKKLFLKRKKYYLS